MTCFPSIVDEASRRLPQMYGGWNIPALPGSFTIPIPSYVRLDRLIPFLESIVVVRAGDAGRWFRPGKAWALVTPYPVGTQHYFTDTAGLCYLTAAQKSANQMGVTRDQRLQAKGSSPLPDVERMKWFHGWTRLSQAPAGAPTASYVGDFLLSLLQVLHDDLTAANSAMVFETLSSPDDILPYTPARLSQIELANTYNALRHAEENALQILAQTQDPSVVARISTTETVTDPIGRLVTGAIVQQGITGAMDTPLPSGQGIGPEGIGVNSVPPSTLPGSVPLTPPRGSPEMMAPAETGRGWIGIAVALIPLLLPKR